MWINSGLFMTENNFLTVAWNEGKSAIPQTGDKMCFFIMQSKSQIFLLNICQFRFVLLMANIMQDCLQTIIYCWCLQVNSALKMKCYIKFKLNQKMAICYKFYYYHCLFLPSCINISPCCFILSVCPAMLTAFSIVQCALSQPKNWSELCPEIAPVTFAPHLTHQLLTPTVVNLHFIPLKQWILRLISSPAVNWEICSFINMMHMVIHLTSTKKI